MSLQMLYVISSVKSIESLTLYQKYLRCVRKEVKILIFRCFFFVQTINGELFSNMNSLEVLSLRKNKIERVLPYSFSGE